MTGKLDLIQVDEGIQQILDFRSYGNNATNILNYLQKQAFLMGVNIKYKINAQNFQYNYATHYISVQNIVYVE